MVLKPLRDIATHHSFMNIDKVLVLFHHAYALR